MPLPKSGIQLVAENASEFYRDLTRGQTALAAFSQSATGSAASVGEFAKATNAVKLDALGNTLADQRTRLGLLNEKLEITKTKYGETSLQARTQQATIDRLTDRIGANEAMYGLLAQAINEEAAAQEAATQEAAAAAAEQARLGSAYDEVKRAASGAVGDTDQLGKATKDSGDKAEDAKGKFSSFGEIGIGALRKLGEVGVEQLAGLGGKIVSFVGNSITAAGDYEGALNRFKAVSGGALTEAGLSVDTFSQKFLQLGADTQFSARQAADAANELAKGGVPVREILSSATEATLNLASAAELDLAPAAAIVAKQLGVWGKDGVSATNVVDALSQAANASTVDVDELALGLANAGGSARVAGVSFDETVQTLGILAPGFSSAADAGTSYKTFLSRLPGTTAASVEAMTDLGLYTRETGSAFYDASGNFVGMKAASELLQKATADLSEEQKTLAFNTIFGADAIRTAAALAEGGGAQFDTFAKAMDGVGSAADQAKQRNQGFNFAMETLRGSIETVQILIGQKLLPVITGFITDAVTPAVNAIGYLVTNFASVADTVEDFLLPAVVTAGVAITGFAIINVGGLATALTMAGVGLVLTAQRFIAAGLAAGKAAIGFIAANAPLLIIAASIGGVVYAFNQYSEQVDKLIEQSKTLSKGYQATTAANEAANDALARGTNLSEANRATLQAAQTELNNTKNEYDAFIGSIANANDLTEEEANKIRALDQEMSAQSATVTSLAGHMNGLTTEHEKTNQAMLDSMMGTVAASGGWSNYSEQVRLSDEVMKEALDTLARVRDDGVAVFDDITQNRTTFQADLENLKIEHEAKMAKLEADGNAEAIKAEQDSYAAQQQTAAAAYQEQQEAQRQSLGIMLIDYINAQAQLNPEFRKSSGALVQAISEEYGVQASLSQQLFGSMLDDIDKYATDGSGDIDGLIGKLRENEQNATDTQQAMDSLSKEYRAELISNFDDEKISADDLTRAIDMFPAIKNTDLLTNFLEGKIDAQELLAEINKLPSQKNINVHTSYTSSGTPPGNQKPTATPMASGGFMSAGKPYITGDAPGGRLTPYSELIVPKQDSFIFNASQTRALLKGGKGTNRSMAGAFGGASTNNNAFAGAAAERGKPASNNPFGGGAKIERGGAGILGGAKIERGGETQRTPRTPVESANRAAINQSTVNNKTYILNMETQQSTGDVKRDFRMMETFSLG